MNRSKKWLTICMAGVMTASLMGCGGPAGADGTDRPGGDADNADKAADDTAMGRYMESSQRLDIGEPMDLVALSDGRLELLENGAEGRYVSSDGGVTWEADVLPDWYDLVTKAYMLDMKGAPDGSVALLCHDYSFNFEEEESGGEEASEEEEEPEENGASSSEASSSEAPSSEEGNWLCLISPEGEARRYSAPAGEIEGLSKLAFSEDGEGLYLITGEGECYEIDWETGENRLLMQLDIWSDVFCVWGHYLAVKNEQDGVLVYDLDTREKIEDEVLEEFVALNYRTDDGIWSSTYTIFPAEDGGIYIAGAMGLHRHVIGGAVMEQVINGGLCGLSNPKEPVSVMMRTTNDGFLAAFSGGKLSAFTFDPNMPSMPSQSFSVYSLTENDVIRQAITRYQEANPDVYVEYHVGMGTEEGVTREDAVKKLNTEIMAGKGPDFMVLDGLPMDSYREKGVLADLTPYLAEVEAEETLLPNIKESFTEEDGIYMIPAAVTLPMYYTEGDNITGVSDLSALADLFEGLRKGHPGEELMELYSKDMLFDELFPVSAPKWVTEEGQPNPEQIADDIAQMKRIYDACMEGLPNQVLMKYNGYTEGRVASNDKATAYNNLGGGAIQMAGGNVLVSMGELSNGYNYGLLQSVTRLEGKEKNRLEQIPGGVKDVFTPVTLMGINGKSQKSDLVADFMKTILSKEVQSMIYPIGFPINEEGLELYMESLGGQVPESLRKPGEAFGGYGFSADDGKVISFSLYVPTLQERAEIIEWLKAARTPYLENIVLEAAVREAAALYLDGICSLEEMMDAVSEKSAIIMSE